MAVFTDANSALGITTTQYGVLFVLAHIPDLDQITLARLVGLDRSTAGLVLALLERRGTIERAVHREDRRRRTLILTDKGRALFERTRVPAAQAIDRLLGPVTEADKTRFLDLLEQLVVTATSPLDPAMTAQLRGLYRRPGFLIRRAHQISTALFIDECRAFDVTPTQFGMLFALERCPDLDQATLAWLVRLDRSTNAMVVGLLEARGLLERRTDPEDRRRRVLNLTPAGRHLLEDVAPLARRAVDRLVEPFSEDETRFLLAILEGIAERHGS